MKILVKRVRSANLKFLDKDVLEEKGSISKGLLIFIGFDSEDSPDKFDFFIDKIINLRVFEDSQGKCNLSIKDSACEIMLVPNFSLCANVKKGRRPSFDSALAGKVAKDFFNYFLKQFSSKGFKLICGEFGKQMFIENVEDGPLNIIIDSSDF